jgi:hypothetical protein
MAGIDATTLEQAGLARAPTADARANDKLGQEQFLKLMITQLNNQDPFKPLESGEFLGQLAQFGTVSGIQDLQQSFQGLAGSMQSNQALQAAGLVGRSVYVPAQEAWLPPERRRQRRRAEPGRRQRMSRSASTTSPAGWWPLCRPSRPGRPRRIPLGRHEPGG